MHSAEIARYGDTTGPNESTSRELGLAPGAYRTMLIFYSALCELREDVNKAILGKAEL